MPAPITALSVSDIIGDVFDTSVVINEALHLRERHGGTRWLLDAMIDGLDSDNLLVAHVHITERVVDAGTLTERPTRRSVMVTSTAKGRAVQLLGDTASFTMRADGDSAALSVDEAVGVVVLWLATGVVASTPRLTSVRHDREPRPRHDRDELEWELTAA